MKNDTKKIAFPAMRCFRMMGNATMKIRYSGDIIPFTGRLSCPVRAERKSQPELHESVDFIHHDLIT